jgi:valyl-tRNA synthetase
VVTYRQLCNKLWNDTKCAMTNFGEGWQRPVDLVARVRASGMFADKWVLQRLAVCVERCNRAFVVYEFAEAITDTYNFWLYDLWDYYLDILKPVVKGQDEAAKELPLGVRSPAWR